MFISIPEALKLSGRPSRDALDRWIRRHNLRHPDAPVLKRCAAVHRESLLRAMAVEVEQHTPHINRAKAIQELAAIAS